MKIIGIIGGPRGLKGSTGKLMLETLKAAVAEGAEVETITIPGGAAVNPCSACDACHKTGVCPQKDDFELIKKKIMQSDAVVLASPNYIRSVSAQLKAFLDRCCGVIHCMSFEGKYGAAVVTSGGGEEQEVADYINNFLITTGITPVGSVCAVMGTITGDEFPREILDNAAALGRKLVHDFNNKIISPEVAAAKSKFEDRMRWLMNYKKEEWPYEANYWKEHRNLS